MIQIKIYKLILQINTTIIRIAWTQMKIIRLWNLKKICSAVRKNNENFFIFEVGASLKADIGR
jgi:hypothetical protein